MNDVGLGNLKIAGLSVALLLVLPGQAAPPVAGLRSITVTARPITQFRAGSAEHRIGAVAFRGGLVLTASDPDFGGFSGVWRSPDGTQLVAVSDRARWLTARVVYAGRRLAGVGDASIAPVLSASGTPLARTRFYDTEALAIADGAAYVAVERAHAVMRFDWGRDRVMARARPIAMPPETKALRSNNGLEGIGVAPPASPIAGALVAVAERSAGADEPSTGFILTGKGRGAFQVTRRNGFDVTDLAFLPGGDLLILERYYAPLRSIAMRIRRIDGGSIKAGAILDGAVLIEADFGYEIDNMEGPRDS